MRFLRCLWHRWWDHESFRTIFSDGNRTRRLTYREADSLFHLFDGEEIVFDPWED